MTSMGHISVKAAFVWLPLVLLVACSSNPLDTTPTPSPTTSPSPNATTDDVELTEDDYLQAFADSALFVSDARAGSGSAGLVLDVCDGFDDCALARDSLKDELEALRPVLLKHVELWENITPPLRFQPVHNEYLESIIARIDAGDLWLDGFQRLDDSAIDLSYERFFEADGKFVDAFEELDRLCQCFTP